MREYDYTTGSGHTEDLVQEDLKISLVPETDELRGCWRIFFLAVALAVVVAIGAVGYRLIFVDKPWQGAADRAADAEAELIAGLPEAFPNVIGKSLVDGLFVLTQAGYPEILLFSIEQHGVAPPEYVGNPGLAVLKTIPAAGEPSSITVSVWAGDWPERPENVPEDSWWFPHEVITAERGTFQCLNCHEAELCSKCHEERLHGGAGFLINPEVVPELAAAVASASGANPTDILAVHRGNGWYRVDFALNEHEEPRETAARAQEQALATFPAAFRAVPEARVIVMRWVDPGTGEPNVEIGLEKETYLSTQWLSLEPGRIPWVADRYTVRASRD